MIAATGTVIEARFRLHNNRHHAVAQPTSRTPRPGNAAFAKQASNRSPQKAAGSNPAGGTEKFAAHMAFMRDIETHVPSTCHPLRLSSARRCVLEGTFQFGAAMLRSSLRPSPWPGMELPGIELARKIALTGGNVGFRYVKRRESTRNDLRIRERC
jgi:hypothetical protein